MKIDQTALNSPSGTKNVFVSPFFCCCAIVVTGVLNIFSKGGSAKKYKSQKLVDWHVRAARQLFFFSFGRATLI